MSLTYITGNIFEQHFDVKNKNFLLHVVNNQGGWGAGFVLEISKRWKQPEKMYRAAFKKDSEFPLSLGSFQISWIKPHLAVVNLCAQDGFRNKNNPTPFSKTALNTCLANFRQFLYNEHRNDILNLSTIKIGSGLGGAKWPDVEKVLANHFEKKDLTVYQLEDSV